MLSDDFMNENDTTAYNNFLELSQFPYKILELLIGEDSDEETETMKKGVPTRIAELWKMLKYNTIDCLDEKYNKTTKKLEPVKPYLSYKEREALIWDGQSNEGDYSVFIKPLIGESLVDSEKQVQLRFYRLNIAPITRNRATICFEFDIITNEKTCLVKRNKILMERTDIIETTLMSFLNGRDIGIGNSFLSFDKELTRTCSSNLNISNSKTLYGRSFVMGLVYSDAEVGGICG